MIGASVSLWTQSTAVCHVFFDRRHEQCHRLVCRPYAFRPDGRPIPQYEQVKHIVREPSFPKYQATFLPREITRDLAESGEATVLVPKECWLDTRSVWVAQFDFSNHAPLGQFGAIWLRKPDTPDADLLTVQHTLWPLARVLATLLCNHYPIHENTYFPSFQMEGEKNAAILFADIRNSTSLFEIARLGGEAHMRRVEALLRGWFRYAADLIAQPGIGYLHRFTGDGLIATFGEYAVGEAREQTGCVLALHAAKHLVDSFQDLYAAWLLHPRVASFHLDYNEDVQLRLGVGINFGRVRFTYIGRSVPESPAPLGGGHLEYTAFGDHMNTAARLADLASKPLDQIEVTYRGEPVRDDPYRIAPIVLSHTAATRLTRVLGTGESAAPNRRGRAQLRGKGQGILFYEVGTREVDDGRCAGILRQGADAYFAAKVMSPPSVDDAKRELYDELEAIGPDSPRDR